MLAGSQECQAAVSWHICDQRWYFFHSHIAEHNEKNYKPKHTSRPSKARQAKQAPRTTDKHTAHTFALLSPRTTKPSQKSPTNTASVQALTNRRVFGSLAPRSRFSSSHKQRILLPAQKESAIFAPAAVRAFQAEIG